MEQQQGAAARQTPQPEKAVVQLNKAATGLGLSIVAAKGAGQEKLGIYVKTVVKGGAADIDGRLRAGDQLLKVDGQSLVGITQEKAAEYLVKTGPVVTLEIAKQGAICHGLATLLSQPSPDMGRSEFILFDSNFQLVQFLIEQIRGTTLKQMRLGDQCRVQSLFRHSTVIKRQLRRHRREPFRLQLVFRKTQ